MPGSLSHPTERDSGNVDDRPFAYVTQIYLEETQTVKYVAMRMKLASRSVGTTWLGLAALTALAGFWSHAGAQGMWRHPQPGDIYREYTRTMMSYADWRVTDPNTQDSLAMPNLPNKILSISIGDLQGAIRAEAVIDLWGGHAGTTGKAIRFNNNAWIAIPELTTTPGSGECWVSQPMVTVDIPLSQLVQGTNTFEGKNTGQTCWSFGWGQHGQNGIIIRIYYDASKAHATGSITSPVSGEIFGENPVLAATTSGGADRVDFIAYYKGWDTDGDGVYTEWHYDYHRMKTQNTVQIKNHAGTATNAPFQVTWDTDLVPDQNPGAVKLLARIRNSSGIWYVTDVVSNLTLQRTDYSVRMYSTYDMPQRFSVRTGRTTATVHFTIPTSDTLSNATAATLIMHTFNGIDGYADSTETHYTKVNTWTAPNYGADHFYSIDFLPFPPSALKSGTNAVAVNSLSTSTGIYCLWPGPGIIVRYAGASILPPPAPAQRSPGNNAQQVATSPVLTWSPSPTATSYRVDLALDSLFSSMAASDSTVTDTLYHAPKLLSETRYYWRVSAKSANGRGPASATWSFVTIQGGPALVSPVNDSTDLLSPITLRWQTKAGALAYWVQVSSDSTFATGLAVNDSTVLSTERVVNNLAGSTRYWWRVATRFVATYTPFSESWTFVTALQIPQAVELVSPTSGASVSGSQAAFVWRSAGPTATRYWIEIGYDAAFQFHEIDSTGSDTTALKAGLVFNHTYFWRVRAGNGSGWGSYGPTWSFTSLLTGIGEESAVPETYSLSPNYPNPFNPSTEIRYGLPLTSQVRLEVVNILGERVALLEEGIRNAGYHRATFNADGLPSGVYLCRLTAGSFVGMQKMLLMK